MRHIESIVGFVLITCCSTLLLGAEATTVSSGASTEPSGGTAMQVVITAVSGIVQVRQGDGKPWVMAEPQMVVFEGAELRTGPHSSVTCVIPPDQTFTLDRLGTVRVEDAIRNGNKITTDLIMKYGRTHYDIEGGGLEHEASIISPSSTLAVRGTNVVLTDQPPFKPEAISYTGRAMFTYAGNTLPVGKKSGSYAKVVAGEAGVADTAIGETLIDPKYSQSLTQIDEKLLATEVARGAVISYNPLSSIPIVSNSRPSFDSELPSTLPNGLDFVLRWTGNANLNIEVGVDPGDALTNIGNGFNVVEFLYPGFGLQDSKSGGHIPFDNIGGPNGGEEIAYWAGKVPPGLYGIAAQSISGASTSFTFNVYANGTPLEMFYFDANGDEVKSTQVTQTLPPGQNATAIVPVPDVPLLDGLIPDDPAGNPNPGINPPGTPAAKPAQFIPRMTNQATVIHDNTVHIMGPILPASARKAGGH